MFYTYRDADTVPGYLDTDSLRCIGERIIDIHSTVQSGTDVERAVAWSELKDVVVVLSGWVGDVKNTHIDVDTFDWDGLDRMIKETPLTMWRQRRSQGERAFRSREGAARVARAHISKIEDKLGRMAQHMAPTGGVVDVLNKVREGKYILPFHLEGQATWDDATEYQNWVDELTALIDEWYCELVGESDRDMRSEAR